MKPVHTLFALLLSLTGAPGLAAPTVVLTPDKTVPDVGDSLTVRISLKEFPATHGGGIDLSFNPEVVRVEAVNVDSSTWRFINRAGTVDNANGTVSDVVFSDFQGVEGDLPVATVQLSVVGEGAINLSAAPSSLNPFSTTGGTLPVVFDNPLASATTSGYTPPADGGDDTGDGGSGDRPGPEPAPEPAPADGGRSAPSAGTVPLVGAGRYAAGAGTRATQQGAPDTSTAVAGTAYAAAVPGTGMPYSGYRLRPGDARTGVTGVEGHAAAAVAAAGQTGSGTGSGAREADAGSMPTPADPVAGQLTGATALTVAGGHSADGTFRGVRPAQWLYLLIGLAAVVVIVNHARRPSNG